MTKIAQTKPYSITYLTPAMRHVLRRMDAGECLHGSSLGDGELRSGKFVGRVQQCTFAALIKRGLIHRAPGPRPEKAADIWWLLTERGLEVVADMPKGV